jgi:hypothetical protein
MSLPNLSLNLEKKFSNTNTNENKNENNNKITNTIIINDPNKNLNSEIIKNNDNILSSEISIPRDQCQTPEIIKLFRDYLLITLIQYFKDEIILCNNVIETSKRIIMKEIDLKKLIAILITDNNESRITIESEIPDHFKCCCLKELPIYKKISSIVIDKKQEFKIFYNQFYIQMQQEFNISLDYVLI